MAIRRIGGIAGLAGVVGVMLLSAPASGQDPEVEARPTFTPYTLKPELKNAADVTREMMALYPPLLRDAGIGGSAVYWLFIDRTGEVRNVQLFRSSGYRELDEAAARVAHAMQFRPAQNRDRPVDVWVQIPVNFVADAALPSRQAEVRRSRPLERQTEELPPPPPARRATRAEIMLEPTFTPYTVKPELSNQAETRDALQRHYPPLLRDAGIGGTSVLWFLIDEEGAVVERSIAKASGYEALDAAALRVAETMRFTPARNRDERVLVWVQIPITFSSK
jgi:TonB family protein